MGVPKFFRYISERYPCLSEFCLEDKIPQFDNLYLDMNGIIHNCSHPDDANIYFRITEEIIFRDIFKYIDKLFYLIKPQKLFFMAVDGVAPRAKMNQQRSRRFRSAKDAEVLERNAEKRGEKLPDEARFDSNCITPGTEFMVRLQTALKYFVKFKLSTNPLWKKCRIILSGHETPGEGEHKIMEYIRYLKSRPDYDTDTRHCLYGLDADLIILGLCTHELHFALLREEVKFGRKSKPVPVEETRFFLLHLGLLREYLEIEFDLLKEKICDFDIEKIIDDWILMGFLVGNDFIPHLPNLHISSNALPILYKAYIKVRSELDGYINESGKLNLVRLQKYFEELAISEKECLVESIADLKYFDAKCSGNGADNLPEAFADIDVDEIKSYTIDEDLAKLMEDSEMFLQNELEDEVTQEQLMDEEFIAYKKNYYMKKLNYETVTSDVIKEQTECYITALQWILHYYYHGVASWEWFYPHHYAPFVSDIKDFTHMQINFDLGKPFLPFQQLLAVLPAASRELLPEAFRDLMIKPDSELIEYYPKDFKTDLNGKKQEWEAVVLIPFIDEQKLLKAMEPCLEHLTLEEKDRNKHGPMLQYDFSKTSQGTCNGPYSFKTLHKVLCTEKEIWRDDISKFNNKHYMKNKINVSKNVYFPGFPTMKHLNYIGELRNVRIRVFEQPGRNESIILIPENRIEETDLYVSAQKYLNKEVYIGWPHLTEAKVIAISTKEKLIKINMEEIEQDPRFHDIYRKQIIDHHMTRMGIDFQDLNILVHAMPLNGTEYVFSTNGKMILRKNWSKEQVIYPAQGVVSDIKTRKHNLVPYKKIEDVFPIDTQIFMLGQPYLGSEGKILDTSSIYTSGRIKVYLTVLHDPNFMEAKQIQEEIEMQYMNSYKASSILGIQPNCLARITGSIFVIEGTRRDNLPDSTPKLNIGLQLKFPKNNEEVIGYMHKAGSQWLYSPKAIQLVQEYLSKFPKIFELISSCTSRDIYFESDLFPEDVGGDGLRNMISWLKSQEYNKAEKVPCGTITMEKEAVQAVIVEVEKLKTLPVKYTKLQVKPHLILKSGLKIPEMIKNRKRPLHLFDRIVVIKSTYQVPLGYKGTILAIYPITNQNSVRFENVKEVTYFYDILFDKTLPEGATLHGLGDNRVFKISENSILEMCSQVVTQKNDIPESNFIENQNLINMNPSNSNVDYSFRDKNNMQNHKSYGDQLLMSLQKSATRDSFAKRDNLSDGNNHRKNNISEQIKMEKNLNFMREISPLKQQQGLQSTHENFKQGFPSCSNMPESFDLISKNEFLNPPLTPSRYSMLQYSADQKFQREFSNKNQETINVKENFVEKAKNDFIERTKSEFKISYPTDISHKDVGFAQCTNTLKQMLGINFSKLSSTKNPDTRKTAKLPQPPSNWRIDASNNKSKNDSCNSNSSNWRIDASNNKSKIDSCNSNSSNWRIDASNNKSKIDSCNSNSSNWRTDASNNKSKIDSCNSNSSVPFHTLSQFPQHLPTAASFFSGNTPAYTSFNHSKNNTKNSIQASTSSHVRYFDTTSNDKSHYHRKNIPANIHNESSTCTNTNDSKIRMSNDKSAFIPLQALKNIKKSQEQSNKSQIQNYNHTYVNSTKEQHEENKVSSFGNDNKNFNLPTTEPVVKKQQLTGRYRTPKIAAKFDHAFVSH